jgi:ATP-dependent protease ClpP protease subunit
MKNKFWTMTAKAGGELEILLYSVIGEDFWTGDGITAKKFAEDLKAAGSVSKICLRVNSPGGNVMDGLAMFNTLLAHPATVTAQIDGLAASIASVIIMAASQIDIGENSLLMIHNPSTLVAGDANEMRKMAETLDVVKASMIRAYRRHTTKSESEIGELMDSETWWGGSEAVEAGFADRVINQDESEDDLAAAVRSPIFAKFRHVPARVAQIAARCAPAGDDDRRRKNRLRTLEIHEMWEAESRALRMETHALQLRNMIAAEPSEDLQRRRILARNDRELRAMRAAELAKMGMSEEKWRRRRMAENAKEIAGWAPPVIGGGYLCPVNG